MDAHPFRILLLKVAFALSLDSAPADVAANLTFLAVGGGCSDLQGRPELASTNVCVRDLDLAAFNVPDGRLGVVADGLTLFQLAIDSTPLVSPLAKLVWYCEELSKNLQRLFALSCAVFVQYLCPIQTEHGKCSLMYMYTAAAFVRIRYWKNLC